MILTVKSKIGIIAIAIVLISALHALWRGLGGVNVAGLVLGFLLFLYINLQKERPSPVPVIPKIDMPERKAQPKTV